jgi:hypothetical protein
MSDTQDLKTVRVFVAHPSDMSAERQALAEVVERLNESTARGLGCLLECKDWSTAVRPAMGTRPEDVILEKLPVQSWDIFVGLLWQRFGTPTGGRDPETGLPWASGTQEEFKLAYRSWRERQTPDIMFYRCLRAVDPRNKGEELARIDRFFEEFAANGEHPGLVQDFVEVRDFERMVNQHLGSLLFEKAKQHRIPIKGDGPSQVVERTFVSGQAYDVASLSVDIVKHGDMVRRHPDKAKAILAWFEEFVFRICAPPLWADVNWTPDGGLFVTTSEGMHDRVALAGIRMLEELDLHNLDPSNPVTFAIRVAASEGPLQWNDKPGRISAHVLNFTKYLEDEYTEAGEFCITDKLHAHLHEKVQSAFRNKSRFRNTRILAYRSTPLTTAPPPERLSAFVATTAQQLKRLVQIEASGDAIQEATCAVDAAYGQMETFLRYFRAIDDRWALDYLRRIDAWAEALLDGEKECWENVQMNFARAMEGTPEHEYWTSISAIVSGRRMAVLNPLVRLKAQTQIRIDKASVKPAAASAPPLPPEQTIEMLTAARPFADLEKNIRSFLSADELQEEQLFAGVMSNDREALIAAITTPDALGELRQPFLDRLWTLSDLILIEELHDRRSAVFTSLVRTPDTRARYTVLAQLLRGSELPTREVVKAKFAEAQLPFAETDLHVVWRSVAVGANQARRVAALQQVPVEILWRTIVAPNIQVSALWALAQRFRSEGDDWNKVFFDCIHARIRREIQATGREVDFVSKLLSHFFSQPLFVQSPYFERLDDLLLSFRTSSAATKIAVELFDKVAVKLKQIHEDLGNPKATIPGGIFSLPLPVQRHLASEGRYMDSFVLHPDPRIAGESFPFITIGNVERLIRYREINELLFQKVQRQKEFFTRPGTVTLVLRHPKCTADFAALHLPRLSTQDLERLAADPSVSSIVREIAKRVLRSRKGH